jgi:hypothetical protein
MGCVVIVVVVASSDVGDVRLGAEYSDELVLVVVNVPLHDLHARTQQPFESVHVQNWRENKIGSAGKSGPRGAFLKRIFAPTEKLAPRRELAHTLVFFKNYPQVPMLRS